MPIKYKTGRVNSRTKLYYKRKSSISSFSKQNKPDLINQNNKQSQSKSKRLFRPHNRHARRTNIHINTNMLHRITNTNKSNSKKTIKPKRLQIYQICQEYKRKMSQGFQISDEQYMNRRKISWSQQSQYVEFNKNNSIDSLKLASKHKFSIDQ